MLSFLSYVHTSTKKMSPLFGHRADREAADNAAAVTEMLQSHRARMQSWIAEIEGLSAEDTEAMDAKAAVTAPERSFSSSTHYTSSTIYHPEYLTPKLTFPGKIPCGYYDYSTTSTASTITASNTTTRAELKNILQTMDAIISNLPVSADISIHSSPGLSTVLTSIDSLLSKNNLRPHPAILKVIGVGKPKDLEDHWRIIQTRIENVNARKEEKRSSALREELVFDDILSEEEEISD
ncbi:MAG: hypothetical protein MMC33_006661 [Icmadophila ericetorum]|nr:hypothetical protein [Icmadophila ericetorum]